MSLNTSEACRRAARWRRWSPGARRAALAAARARRHRRRSGRRRPRAGGRRRRRRRKRRWVAHHGEVHAAWPPGLTESTGSVGRATSSAVQAARVPTVGTARRARSARSRARVVVVLLRGARRVGDRSATATHTGGADDDATAIRMFTASLARLRLVPNVSPSALSRSGRGRRCGTPPCAADRGVQATRPARVADQVEGGAGRRLPISRLGAGHVVEARAGVRAHPDPRVIAATGRDDHLPADRRAAHVDPGQVGLAERRPRRAAVRALEQAGQPPAGSAERAAMTDPGG